MEDLFSDMKRLLLEGVNFSFIGEIIGRTAVMFLVILIILRLSGRRGVRQLTLFEVAIILGMGSAAGDPMFQKDLPVVYGIAVLLVIIMIYKLVTWVAARSVTAHRMLEGDVMVVVRNGLFEVKRELDKDFSRMEFFSELRNQSIEHLGQVRMALLETDGSMSVLFYADDQVRYGLPLFPPYYNEIDPRTAHGPIACMHCGYWTNELLHQIIKCPRCKYKKWAKAIKTTRIA